MSRDVLGAGVGDMLPVSNRWRPKDTSQHPTVSRTTSYTKIAQNVSSPKVKPLLTRETRCNVRSQLLSDCHARRKPKLVTWREKDLASL